MADSISAAGLQPRTLQFQSADWTFRLVTPTRLPAPLLVVLHGQGIDGRVMARWTGLARRGVDAGFAVVFPDTIGPLWDDTGAGRRDGLDDAQVVSRLIEKLVQDGIARDGRTLLIGLSNGAFFAERLARHGLLKVDGLVLVAGTARTVSHDASPRPQQSASVLMIEGTGDRLVPYGGGVPRGPTAFISRRRARKFLQPSDSREIVAAEVVAGDWAAINGLSLDPSVERLPGTDVMVDRLSWRAPGAASVLLYRVVGGGHGWPGGPQYLPRFLIGRIPRSLDATGIALDFARSALA